MIPFFIFLFVDKYTPFHKVVFLGLNAANIGFKFTSLMIMSDSDKEEFKKDGEMFSKTAKAINELLETTMEERDGWNSKIIENFHHPCYIHTYTSRNL